MDLRGGSAEALTALTEQLDAAIGSNDAAATVTATRRTEWIMGTPCLTETEASRPRTGSDYGRVPTAGKARAREEPVNRPHVQDAATSALT